MYQFQESLLFQDLALSCPCMYRIQGEIISVYFVYVFVISLESGKGCFIPYKKVVCMPQSFRRTLRTPASMPVVKLFLAFIFSIALYPSCEAQQQSKPNFIIMQPDDLSFYGTKNF